MASTQDRGPGDDGLLDADLDVLSVGAKVGRYLVVERLGAGAMGVVYAAYDPKLDRKIALKLLRPQHGSGDHARRTARLEREAQAIAKLSHPNVISIFDVGVHEGQVFMAMEYLAGGTLWQWVNAKKRPWREIVKMFIEVGHGLAAAHEEGLVHRDFKPDNVLLDKGGKPKVVDFGLVWSKSAGDLSSSGSGETDATTGDESPTLSQAQTAAALTRTGALAGTPAYMAPEQFLGRPVDARTDQFAFCVALFEALYGERPFAGETVLTLADAVTNGRIRAIAKNNDVPGWVRACVLQGLRVGPTRDPDRRFPSMNALLVALATDPRVRVRRTVAAVAVLACFGVTAVAVRRVSGSQAQMCRGGAERLAGIWEPHGVPSARKDEIHRAFAATGRSYAEQAFTSVSGLLDQYTGRWLGMYAETCEATHLRGDQSAEVMDLRMGCLQERLVSVRALVDVFKAADGTVVENAVSAAGSLPQLDRCADVTLLRAVVKPPNDESTRRRVEELRGEVARLDALRDAGHCADARALADGLVNRIKQTAYLPLFADTLNSAALIGDECGSTTVDIQRFREAYTAGLAAHHDEAAARAAIILSGTLFDRLGQHETGRDWLEIARAMMARIGGHPRLESWLLTVEGAILSAEGDGKTAAELYEKAGAIIEKLLGKDHPDFLRLLGNKGTALLVARRYDESLAASTAALNGGARVLGPGHPLVAMWSNNLGEVLNALHRYAEAHAAFRRALEVWRESAADPSFRAYGLVGEGLAFLGERKPHQAVAPLSEALRIRVEKQVDPEHMGEVRFALARALWFQPSEREKARALALKARADYGQVKSAGPILATIDNWLRASSN